MDLKQIHERVIAGDAPGVKELVEQAVAEGVPPAEIISGYLIPAMTEVGARFERQEFYVPEMLIAARAMQTGLGVLKPLVMEGELETAGRMVIGTVRGDLHDIGKNLVSMMFEGAGFEVTDLGVDVGPERFVSTVGQENPDILGMSALLTTTMPAMRNTIEALVEAGLRDKVKVLVGGAPLTQAYADQVGADGYAPDAGSAVRKAKELLGIV
ncbi:MAG TPA: cobalamin-binding protein [Chloroflexi bacterium]|nr:cobalamin-binding protein [Chloroflexota bacterium]